MNSHEISLTQNNSNEIKLYILNEFEGLRMNSTGFQNDPNEFEGFRLNSNDFKRVQTN